MDQVYPDNGLLQWVFNGISSSGVNYHLRVNQLQVSLTDTISSYTECSLPGYASVNVKPAAFTATSVLAHVATAIAPVIQFTCSSGSATCYGYYVTDATNTYLMATATFDAPQTLSNSTPISVIPVFGDYSALAS